MHMCQCTKKWRPESITPPSLAICQKISVSCHKNESFSERGMSDVETKQQQQQKRIMLNREQILTSLKLMILKSEASLEHHLFRIHQCKEKRLCHQYRIQLKRELQHH